jgi:peroxiredoxin-like protein
MTAPHYYNVRACWTRDCRGRLDAPGISNDLHFSSPPEFNGDAGMWTPEHLLIAAAASCFVGTFRAMADASKLEVRALEVRAEGVLERPDGGYRFTAIHLYPDLTIANARDYDRAARLLAKAERVCLITHSLAAEVRMQPRIRINSSGVRAQTPAREQVAA